MDTVTIRDLRNHGGEVVARAQRGETLLVTSSGKPVACITPPPRRLPSPAELVQHAQTLDPVDLDALRADLDNVLDPAL
jgi:prevent-host-death family protein